MDPVVDSQIPLLVKHLAADFASGGVHAHVLPAAILMDNLEFNSIFTLSKHSMLHLVNNDRIKL